MNSRLDVSSPSRRARFAFVDFRLRQGEDEDGGGAGVASPPEGGGAAGHDGDVLLAGDFIGDDASADGASGLEPVEDLAGLRVEGEEVAGEFAAEDDAAGGGGDGGVPINFSSTQAPRNTGEVRSP